MRPPPASARAVSTPIPDDAPVTIAVLPVRSTPAMTSAAVDSNPNGVVMRSSDVAGSPAPSVMVTAYSGDGLLGFARDACDKRCGGVLFGDDVDGLAGPDGHVVGSPRSTPSRNAALAASSMSASRPCQASVTLLRRVRAG